MGKGEQIKKTFLGNPLVKKLVPDQVYNDRLAASLQAARASLKGARSDFESLAAVNKTRVEGLALVGPLEAEIAAEQTRGQTEPAKAWENMEALVERAAQDIVPAQGLPDVVPRHDHGRCREHPVPPGPPDA